jgi:hypothetical protein
MIVDFREMKRQKAPSWYVAYFRTVRLGDIDTNEDGHYHYWPELRGGYWDAPIMRAIADKLDELNKPIEEEEDTFFKAYFPNCS